jgi:hypothetical protein
MATLLDPADAAATLPRWSAGRMYAIAFDLDTDALQKSYGSPSWQNAYRDIRDALFEHGFNWQRAACNSAVPTLRPLRAY